MELAEQHQRPLRCRTAEHPPQVLTLTTPFRRGTIKGGGEEPFGHCTPSGMVVMNGTREEGHRSRAERIATEVWCPAVGRRMRREVQHLGMLGSGGKNRWPQRGARPLL